MSAAPLWTADETRIVEAAARKGLSGAAAANMLPGRTAAACATRIRDVRRAIGLPPPARRYTAPPERTVRSPNLKPDDRGVEDHAGRSYREKCEAASAEMLAALKRMDGPYGELARRAAP